MSILIKGMEMPQRCRDCCFAGFVFTCHLAGKTHDDVLRTRPDWCPLVPLPEKHGRLIDADKIPYVESENGCLDDYAFAYDIREIPTIIEAEGGGEDV